MRHYAINLLYNNVHNQVGNLCFDVNGNPVIVNEEEIQAKIAELEAAEPLRLLRIERTRLLQESDWRDLPSYPGTDQVEWRTYRQALRDLTNTETPALNDNGELINVNWPVPPGESNDS
jgi:hypothetical protein